MPTFHVVGLLDFLVSWAVKSRMYLGKSRVSLWCVECVLDFSVCGATKRGACL
ncbi:hypothetical protein CFELI_08855 [Corynebacterium felinum]|uniref:Uncharacterized protein n=1 Tax=Corynebacterium felinum TaxID=131318 RepID=A0ABU2BBQ1_9CORY|nr:hypothetical protein [Corynebacterium felinum]WJY95376.1 hypothetical protein CFELI_08855 [Corynebacterium felinum]